MQMQVEAVQLSKSGRSYNVRSNGKYYVCKAKGIEQTTGRTIEAELGSFAAPNGASVATIESFSLVDSVAGPRSSPAAAPALSRADPWWMPSATRIVGDAIRAGLIKNSQELLAWYEDARDAILASTTAPKPDGLGPDVPF